MNLFSSFLGLIVGTFFFFAQVFGGPRILILEAETRDTKSGYSGAEIFELLQAQTNTVRPDRYADRIVGFKFDSNHPGLLGLDIQPLATSKMNSIVPTREENISTELFLAAENENQAELLRHALSERDITLVLIVDNRKSDWIDKFGSFIELAVKDIMGDARFVPDRSSERNSLRSRHMVDPNSGTEKKEHLFVLDLLANALVIRGNLSGTYERSTPKFGAIRASHDGKEMIQFYSADELQVLKEEKLMRNSRRCVRAVFPGN